MSIQDKYGLELYFGKSHPASVEILRLVRELRKEALSYKRHARSNKYDNPIIVKCEEIGAAVANHFGFEKFFVGVNRGTGSGAFPIWHDPKFVLESLDKRDAKKASNRFSTDEYFDNVDDLDQVIIDREKGYRFKKTVSVSGACYFDLELLTDTNVTDRAVCSYLFHMIGSCFQHTIYGIKNHIHIKASHRKLKKINTILNIISINVQSKFLIPLNLIAALLHRFGIIGDPKVLSGEEVRFIAKLARKFRDKKGNIAQFSDLEDAKREEIHRNIEKFYKRNRNRDFYDDDRGKIFTKLLINVVFAPFIMIFSAMKLITDIGFFAGNICLRDDHFFSARFNDNFAVMYGFVEMADIFKSEYFKFNNNLSTINIIPGNLPIANDLLILMSEVFAGGPLQAYTNTMGWSDKNSGFFTEKDEVRAKQVYNSLKYELRNNTELSKSMKVEITKQMDVAEDYYKELLLTKAKCAGLLPSFHKIMFRIKAIKSTKDLEKFNSTVDEMILSQIIDNTGELTGSSKEKELIESYEKAIN